MEKDKDVKFKATFEVYPEVRIGSLSRLNYKKPNCVIEDEDLEKSIVNLQKRMSKWEPADEVSESGDQIKIDFVGKIEDEEFNFNPNKKIEIVNVTKELVVYEKGKKNIYLIQLF